ncbi:MAG: ubiquitin-like small modifier protein 1 [Halobacteriales archaeon]|nr:ubiquitin-like small modifier protein 1 [Halobacteriales archaeon]
MPIIRIPAVISETGGARKVEVDGDTVLGALRAYGEENGPELEENVLSDGKVKEYINVYINGKDVRDLDGVDTSVDSDDEIRIIPAASGGV